MLNRLMQSEKLKNTSAPCAVNHSVQQTDTPRAKTASAIRTAGQHTGEKGYVMVLSITDAGIADVYNLHVPDGNAYLIEGGIVTHNCYDSIRYMMMDHPIQIGRAHV